MVLYSPASPFISVPFQLNQPNQRGVRIKVFEVKDSEICMYHSDTW